MRRPGTILLLAIFIGALSAAVVYRNLRQQQAKIDEALRATRQESVDVIVAKDNIPIGTRITANQVKSVRWPADIEPEGVLRDPGAAVGKITRTNIGKNQPVVEPNLAEGAGLLSMLITEGMRAMSVKVDNVTGVSGFITPNSRVDVLIAGTPDTGGETGERSKLILQNIRVLATGTSIEQVEDKPVAVPTVTLLLSPEQAEKLTLATRHEPVRLALRNYSDEEFVDTPGVSAAALFRGTDWTPPSSGAAPVKVKQRRAAPRYTVEVLLGETLTKQVLF